MVKKFEQKDEQWREQLSDEQYRVTRQADTEPPFSGIYADHKEMVITTVFVVIKTIFIK